MGYDGESGATSTGSAGHELLLAGHDSDRIDPLQGRAPRGQALQGAFGIPTCKPSLLRVEVADQVAPAIAVDVLGTGAAESQAVLVPGRPGGQGVLIHFSASVKAGSERIA